jgi:hypothetical protein
MAEDETTTETPPIQDPASADTPVVEPKVGWKAFIQMQHLRPAARAGFQTWLTLHGHDPNGYYDRATWEGWVKAALGHQVTH